MSLHTSSPHKLAEERHSVPWWNPFHWSASIWLFVVVLIVMTSPFAVRTFLLTGVPVIPEPFDVREFSNWKVPASQNAFAEYRTAVDMHQQLLVDMQAQGITDAREPDDCIAMLDTGWNTATDATKKWLDVHQESLVLWRKGTQKTQALNESPANLAYATILNVIEDQRLFVELAILEEARAISAGDFEDARQCARAAFRCGGHISQRGAIKQNLSAIRIHATASEGLARWAERPEVTSEQLRQAMADTRSDYQLYESPSNIVKAEYLIARNSLQAPGWVQFLDPTLPGAPRTIASAKAMQFAYWFTAEPNVTLRIFRHVVANELPEIDKPLSRRRKMIGAGFTLLFDPDPAVPLGPGQLDPTSIDRAIERSSLSQKLLPVLKRFDDVRLRHNARQATLEALLAVQAYRRDHGEFPKNLSDLVPEYLDSVPIDPCNRAGGTLLYRRDEPTKAIVWSVAEDGGDDGGSVAIPREKATDLGFIVQ